MINNIERYRSAAISKTGKSKSKEYTLFVKVSNTDMTQNTEIMNYMHNIVYMYISFAPAK